jgi:hypothetical protein
MGTWRFVSCCAPATLFMVIFKVGIILGVWIRRGEEHFISH